LRGVQRTLSRQACRVPENSVKVRALSALFKILGLAGVVIGVISLVICTLIFVAYIVNVIPELTRAAAHNVEIVPPSFLLPLVLSPLGFLRAALLLVAARALLKEKSSAPRWAILYGIVALVTVPVDTYLLHTHGFMSASNSAGALAYAVVRLILPLGFIAYAIFRPTPTPSS